MYEVSLEPCHFQGQVGSWGRKEAGLLVLHLPYLIKIGQGPAWLISKTGCKWFLFFSLTNFSF